MRAQGGSSYPTRIQEPEGGMCGWHFGSGQEAALDVGSLEGGRALGAMPRNPGPSSLCIPERMEWWNLWLNQHQPAQIKATCKTQQDQM